MAEVHLTLQADTVPLQRDLSALAELAERFPDVRDRLLQLFDGGVELACIDGDAGPAVPAGVALVTFRLADAYAEVLAAGRARDA